MGESKDETKDSHEAETKSDAAVGDDKAEVAEEGEGKAEVEEERRELMLSLHSAGLHFELKEDIDGDRDGKMGKLSRIWMYGSHYDFVMYESHCRLNVTEDPGSDSADVNADVDDNGDGDGDGDDDGDTEADAVLSMSPMDAWESALLRKCMKYGVVCATIPIEAGEVVAEEKDDTADTNDDEEKKEDGDEEDGGDEAKDDETTAAAASAASAVAAAGHSKSGMNVG